MTGSFWWDLLIGIVGALILAWIVPPIRGWCSAARWRTPACV